MSGAAGKFPGAVVFCSIQPCTRPAEGDLAVHRDGRDEQIPVCARHAEYIMAYFAGESIEDPTLLSKEIVFVDDVGDDDMLQQIRMAGTYHEIIGA